METIKGYTRDKRSSAIISTDNQGLSAYRAQRDKALQLNQLSQEVHDLKTDMNEIKGLLVKLINGK